MRHNLIDELESYATGAITVLVVLFLLSAVVSAVLWWVS